MIYKLFLKKKNSNLSEFLYWLQKLYFKHYACEGGGNMGGLFTFVKTIFCIPVKNKMPLIHWGMDESLISESWESTMHYGWGRG